jgi:stage II sporulation protein AA (anti-sigma F factor antagonist)
MLHERIYVFQLTAHGPYAVVSAGGELDIAAVDEMRSAVRRAARRSPQVVVDLRPVTFMDTFALRALLELQQEASTAMDWSLHVVPGPGVQRLLDLSGWRDELRWIAPEQLTA